MLGGMRGKTDTARSSRASSGSGRRKREPTRLRRIVVGYLREAKGSLLLATLSMLGLTVTELARPWPLKIVIDNVLLGKALPSYLSFAEGLFGGGKILPLAVFSLAILLIALLVGLFAYLQVYVTSRIGSELVYTLRRSLFSHMQRLSLSFHTRTRSGELMTKIVSDTNTLKDVFAESALVFTSQFLTFVGMFVIMFFLNWKLALMVLATVPLLAGTLFYRYRRARASSRKQRKKEEGIATRINEVMTAVPLVQAFGQESYEEERFDAESAEHLQESIRNARIEAVVTRSVTIIGALGTAAVVFYGAMQVLGGTLTPGDLLIFTAYTQSMFKPVRSLAKLSTRFSKASVGAERIGEILETEPDIQDSPNAIEAPPLQGEVRFENVSFGYGGEAGGVLNDVSFIIEPGQRVALVGASGVGKSTLISLILRLYEPREGSISVDGVDIRDYRLRSFRRQIGIVLQDSVLFGATVRENIAYGKLEAGIEEIEAAARAAGAHDFITRLEHGYDTVIGERGDTLSGGQRQRVAIARAIIRDAPILILDEPMTGLDAESEVEVREALDRLTVGKTSFLITHDLRAVSEADLILLLQDGRIIEQGNHGALLSRSTRYRRLRELTTGLETRDA